MVVHMHKVLAVGRCFAAIHVRNPHRYKESRLFVVRNLKPLCTPSILKAKVGPRNMNLRRGSPSEREERPHLPKYLQVESTQRRLSGT